MILPVRFKKRAHLAGAGGDDGATAPPLGCHFFFIWWWIAAGRHAQNMSGSLEWISSIPLTTIYVHSCDAPLGRRCRGFSLMESSCYFCLKMESCYCFLGLVLPGCRRATSGFRLFMLAAQGGTIFFQQAGGPFRRRHDTQVCRLQWASAHPATSQPNFFSPDSSQPHGPERTRRRPSPTSSLPSAYSGPILGVHWDAFELAFFFLKLKLPGFGANMVEYHAFL